MIGLLYSFFQNPEKTVELWYQKFLEQKKEAGRKYPAQMGIIWEIVEILRTVCAFGLQGCDRYNEEWCRFLIYSVCGENLNEYLITMFHSNHVEMVERILVLLKPIGSKEKDNWNSEFADDFTDRWLVNSSEDQ